MLTEVSVFEDCALVIFDKNHNMIFEMAISAAVFHYLPL